MSEVAVKYHGSKEYHLVYAELSNAARYRGVTTYQAVAQIMACHRQATLWEGKSVR